MCTEPNGPDSYRDTSRWPFQSFPKPGFSPSDEEYQRAYLPWHKSLNAFEASAQVCTFCDIIYSRMVKNWKYEANVRDGDERAVLYVWLGDDKPEANVGGKWRMSTPPGN
jgi:hypothetical protein